MVPMFAVSPIRIKPVIYKSLQGGELHWVPMSSNDQVPITAVVGGFEKGELIYVARAMHNRSLCPGKYVPSTKHAFVAWGHRSHKKNRFEMLCGYNFTWIRTRGNVTPPHSFPGGIAVETNNEDLYIGRAQIGKTNLIPGKVHRHYKTCYIPYKDTEREVYSYEILVTPDAMPQHSSFLVRDSDSDD